MKKLFVKITIGYGADEKFTIDMEEAHKAYFLFNNPDKRGIFSNGVAMVGKNIHSIQPDYHATMGWNPTHKINGDDWNQMKSLGIDEEMKNFLSGAKDVARLAEKDIKLLEKPVSQAIGLLQIS